MFVLLYIGVCLGQRKPPTHRYHVAAHSQADANDQFYSYRRCHRHAIPPAHIDTDTDTDTDTNSNDNAHPHRYSTSLGVVHANQQFAIAHIHTDTRSAADLDANTHTNLDHHTQANSISDAAIHDADGNAN